MTHGSVQDGRDISYCRVWLAEFATLARRHCVDMRSFDRSFVLPWKTAPWEYSSFALWPGARWFCLLKARLGSLGSLGSSVCLESAFRFVDEGRFILPSPARVEQVCQRRFVGRSA